MKLMEIPTPSYVIDEKKLKENLAVLASVEKKAGCKILLAQKCFSCFSEYPLIGSYLSGTTASGLFEARLGFEKMRKENHIFSPAYRPEEIPEIAEICDHIIFNSFSQLRQFGAAVHKIQTQKKSMSGEAAGACGIGLRLNPECSTQQGDHAIYDPCAPGSRLGITRANFDKGLAEDPEAFLPVDGLHMHALCEQNTDDLIRTTNALEEKFGEILSSPQIRWLNLGGGHHITREDYDVDALIELILRLKKTYHVEIYLEPGEAVALNAGYLVTEVMDQVENGITTLILDASAACHMPDVLEMPYRPPLQGSGEAGEKPYTYRLSSLTCLAGDIIGDYSFDHPVSAGEKLVFEDMAIYSMVKNNTFNGIPLPSIYAMDENGDCRLIKSFGYKDFEMRLS
jgi:carboxynorspermidine decarboxylase